MKLSTIFTLAVAALTASSTPLRKRAVGGVSGVPSPHPAQTTSSFLLRHTSLISPEHVQVLMCTGADQTDTCDYQVWPLETCNLLPSPFHHNISTFVPDGEEFYCFPYAYDCGQICTSPEGCTLGGVNSTYEYRYNLTAVEWNTLFGSFECHLGVPSPVFRSRALRRGTGERKRDGDEDGAAPRWSFRRLARWGGWGR